VIHAELGAVRPILLCSVARMLLLKMPTRLKLTSRLIGLAVDSVQNAAHTYFIN
jgi:hypothetical protein